MATAESFLDAPTANPWADPHTTLASILGAGQITSAGRSPYHNAQVGGSATSSHLSNQAVDWAPADGDTRSAALKLAASGVPYDQIIDEGTHVHVGYGPKMRHQALASAKAASADSFLGPPKADDFLGVAPAAPAPPPKLKPDAVPVPPSLMDRVGQGVEAVSSYMADNPVSRYVGQEINHSVVQPVKQAGQAIVDQGKADLKPELNPLPSIQRSLKVAGSVINIPMSMLNAVPHAVLERPYGAAVSAATGGGYSAEQGESDMTTALMGVRGGAHGEPVIEGAPKAPKGRSVVDRVAKFDEPTPSADEFLGAEPAPAKPTTPIDIAGFDAGRPGGAPQLPPPAPEMVDTRGQGQQYHGARAPVGNLSEGYYNPNNIYGGWDTLYTTDAADVAKGYGRKNPAQTVYSVHEHEPVNMFDMEAPHTEDEWHHYFGVGPEDLNYRAEAIELASQDHDGKANLRQVMDEMRDGSRSAGYSKDDVQEDFDTVIQNLQKEGYGGMQHTGGLKTGRDPHTVKIYFKPHEQVELRPHELQYKTPEPVATPTPVAPNNVVDFPQRSMAAAREPTADPTLEAPVETPGGGGPIVGDEPDPVERVDNALYRIGGHQEADKAEVQNFLKGLPDEVKDPATQEELYHAIERKTVEPDYQIPEHLQPAWEAMQGPYKEQTDLINLKRELGDDGSGEPPHAYGYDQGYVARRVEGQTPLFDETEGPSRGDPILANKPTLSSKVQAEKQRTAGYMVTDADGNTHFSPDKPSETDIQDRPYADVRPATTAEIEANTDLRYHKNALLNTVDNVMHLRQSVRNMQVLDELKGQLVEQGLAHRDEHTFMGEDGLRNVVRANSEAPEGFRQVPSIPQLKGMSFAPHIAEVLEDNFGKEIPGSVGDLVENVGKINRLLTSSMFITPIPHVANVGVHWTIGRGFDWVRPGGMRSLLEDIPRAMKEVFTLGPKYRELLREGMAGQYASTQTRNFQKTLLNAAGKKLFADKETASVFAQAANLPVAAVKAAYQAASKALWFGNDVMLMQRVLELERKGLTTRQAIYEAEREIPNYRVPPRIGGTKTGKGGRYASQILQSQAIGLFGRYKYGAARAWAAMVKDMAKGDVKQRTEAVGKALVAIILATGLYPALDKGAQAITGNKNARFKRAGGLAMSDAVHDVITGDKDPSEASGSFFSPGPVGALAVGLGGNHDYFGHDIRTKDAPAWMQAGQAAKYAGTQAFYPARIAEQIGAGNWADAMAQLAGLRLPSDKQVAVKAKYAAKDKKYAARAVGAFKNRVASGDIGKAIDKMGRR